MRFLVLTVALLAGCTARPVVPGLPVASSTSSTPVSVPGVPAAVATSRAVLNGTVTYRPRIALAPGSVVVVRVEDVSLADAPARVVAEQTIRPTGQVPVPFALSYDPTQIDVQRRYAVRAEIRDADGRLSWTTTTSTPVFTQGGPIDGVEVVVQQP